MSYEKPRFLIKHNERVVREYLRRFSSVPKLYPLHELDQCVIEIEY
jgi:hypothetical protein